MLCICTLYPLLIASILTVNICDFCGVSENEQQAAGVGAGPKLKFCSKCGVARYCSKDCQARDWPLHKESCGKGEVLGPGDVLMVSAFQRLNLAQSASATSAAPARASRTLTMRFRRNGPKLETTLNLAAFGHEHTASPVDFILDFLNSGLSVVGLNQLRFPQSHLTEVSSGVHGEMLLRYRNIVLTIPENPVQFVVPLTVFEQNEKGPEHNILGFSSTNSFFHDMLRHGVFSVPKVNMYFSADGTDMELVAGAEFDESRAQMDVFTAEQLRAGLGAFHLPHYSLPGVQQAKGYTWSLELSSVRFRNYDVGVGLLEHSTPLLLSLNQAALFTMPLKDLENLIYMFNIQPNLPNYAKIQRYSNGEYGVRAMVLDHYGSLVLNFNQDYRLGFSVPPEMIFVPNPRWKLTLKKDEQVPKFLLNVEANSARYVWTAGLDFVSVFNWSFSLLDRSVHLYPRAVEEGGAERRPQG